MYLFCQISTDYSWSDIGGKIKWQWSISSCVYLLKLESSCYPWHGPFSNSCILRPDYACCLYVVVRSPRDRVAFV